MKPHLNLLCTALLMGIGLAAQAQTAAVANATSVEGTAYVTRADGRQTILARGSALGVGDALSTTRNSTVRLRFTDGGETAVRPDSRMTVQAYSYARDDPQADNLVIGLLKGGLRAITGSIGKRGNIDAYKLTINTATIGIRGTDYTARLCNGDCKTDAEAIARNARPNSGAPVVARRCWPFATTPALPSTAAPSWHWPSTAMTPRSQSAATCCSSCSAVACAWLPA